MKSRKLTRAEMQSTFSALMRQLKAKKLKLTVERIPSWDYTVRNYPWDDCPATGIWQRWRVFKGTKVPLRNFFECVEDGQDPAEFATENGVRLELIAEVYKFAMDRKIKSLTKKATIENALAAGSISPKTARRMMRCSARAVYEMLSGEPA